MTDYHNQAEGDTPPYNERIRMEQIRALDLEELEEEEVDSEPDPDDDSCVEGRGDGGAGFHGGFTFDTSLTCRHSYLGEVEDIGHTRSFLEGGAIITLPMFYLEGIVLFPEATLPLRVLQPRFKIAVERAVQQENAPYTLGVVHVRARLQGDGVHIACVGTTAEIRQLRHLPDGSINVVTRGRQRFRMRRAWTDADGTPCAEVQVIEEDRSLHIPRDAFGLLACVPHIHSGNVPRPSHESDDVHEQSDGSIEEFENEEGGSLDIDNMVVFQRHGLDSEEAEESALPRWLWRRRRIPRSSQREDVISTPAENNIPENTVVSKKLNGAGWGGASKAWAADELKWEYRASRAFWPHWVYRMFDAYDLARRAADMWRQMVELPCTDDMIRTLVRSSPEALSFFIANKIPLPDARRQELLEIDGAVHRLRREIQLLELMDLICCKSCKATIARRSDMLVMSTDGPLSAFVNSHGYVHETLTLRRARGLNLKGRPEKEHSWFPGYAWTIAYCICDAHMGWRFTATSRDLRPKAFWGIRRSQIASV